MNKYSGIDLYSNNCVVVVSDEDDRICCERRVPYASVPCSAVNVKSLAFPSDQPKHPPDKS